MRQQALIDSDAFEFFMVIAPTHPIFALNFLQNGMEYLRNRSVFLHTAGNYHPDSGSSAFATQYFLNGFKDNDYIQYKRHILQVKKFVGELLPLAIQRVGIAQIDLCPAA